ncbi:MAG: RagB/SusD family nutrient uptake outer membrane protein [Odoribacteraceae bacterium]|jgi:hypothetical protein|nr:RagB/SusD family nutrient uptake outer membrane protein [Odoribacteraceae bacterium]
MKKIYIIILAATLLFPSCNDWLDIDPELEIREQALFTTEQGFMDLLTGAYIRVATPSLYGLNTSARLPEFMAQHWTTTANTLHAHLANFDFTQTASQTLLEVIWLQYYQTIVNLNALLLEIDAREELFTNGNYALIKGEAKGLRAFLHLEILRLWGAAPGEIAMEEKAIPYTREVTKSPQALRTLTYREVFDKILEDLDEAESLLADDPIRHYSNAVLNSIGTLAGINENLPHPADDFHYYRQVRFNYFAVKATKARYHAWLGDMERAAARALEVIAATGDDGTVQFTLGNETAAAAGHLTFPTEHIFAVANSLATETLTPVFFTHATAYTRDIAALENAYEKTLHASDIRFRNNRLWEVTTIPLYGEFVYFKKFNDTEKTAVEDIPLIRLAEMYFIAIEAGHTDLFRDYRVARSLDASLDGTLDSPEAIRARLEKEYRKEFYGEGQMIFFYKRHGYTTLTWPVVKEITTAAYRLPIPQSQSLFE